MTCMMTCMQHVSTKTLSGVKRSFLDAGLIWFFQQTGLRRLVRLQYVAGADHAKRLDRIWRTWRGHRPRRPNSKFLLKAPTDKVRQHNHHAKPPENTVGIGEECQNIIISRIVRSFARRRSVLTSAVIASALWSASPTVQAGSPGRAIGGCVDSPSGSRPPVPRRYWGRTSAGCGR